MNINTIIFLLAGLLLLPLYSGHAQFRSDAESTYDRTGQVVRPSTPDDNNSFLGLQDFQMDHSYEMTVGSVAGNMYNQNMYTNTMHMMFNENLYGRVDLAMAHSPFGPNMMGQDNQTQFFVRNAELNYKMGENTRIQLRFQQLPAGHGYGYGYRPSYHQRNRFHQHNNPWY